MAMTAQDVNFKVNKVRVGPFLVTFAYTGNVISLFSHPEVGYNFGGCCPSGATPRLWAEGFVKNLVCAYGSLKSNDQDKFAQILEADPEFKEAADLYKSWNTMIREADQEIGACERALEAAKLTKKIIQQSCEPVDVL